MIPTNFTKQISRLDFLDFFIKKSREKTRIRPYFVGSSTNLTNNELFELFFGRFYKCSFYVDYDLVKDGFISFNANPGQFERLFSRYVLFLDELIYTRRLNLLEDFL